MSKSVRIRTTPGGGNSYLKVKLEQDFDFLEILSLKLSQEDVYRQFYSDYGVVVGRVIVNTGVGIPNAKVSIFVPMDANEREEIADLYPYRTITSKDSDEIKYNLLPNERQSECHVPIGTFPSKREILDNDLQMEVFDKYYKYTTTTNQSGDFMIFGVPVGNHMMNVDVDLSDIGLFSQKPYDLMGQGNPKNLFQSPTQFKSGSNLNNLTQVKSQQLGVNIMPFWGEEQQNEIGISRVDVDLNYELKPKAIFMGSMFSDTDKNSINKNCQPRKKTGKVCESIPVDGRINMIRKRVDGAIENFSVNGGEVIDEDGVWAYQIPMNLDFMITDEFGKLIPSEDPTKGIPTRTQVRFKIDSRATGSEGRLRTRANYLVPHNPSKKEDVDYEFGEETKDISFRDLYWNKIYTIKNFIPRFQRGDGPQNRKFIGFKDVDECVGSKSPLPFNRIDKDFNPLYTIICFIVMIIIDILGFINDILTAKVLGIRICDEAEIPCVRIKCGDTYNYAPNCDKGTCYVTSGKGDMSRPIEPSKAKAKDCFQLTLADALNVYELDFYNDWINGTLYSFLLKYKHKKSDSKFCDVDKEDNNHIVDVMLEDKFVGAGEVAVREGVIKEYKDELFYAPTTNDGGYKLFATDIVNLGSIDRYDWQGQPSIREYLQPTSYNIPPFTPEDETVTPIADYGKGAESAGLLFNLNCTELEVTPTQSKNIKRICELGVGLDEDRDDEPNGVLRDRKITLEDIEFKFSRDAFIMLNDSRISKIPNSGLSSHFEGQNYIDFRDFNKKTIPQPQNSLYFYFGTQLNKSAVDKMNKRFFEPCVINLDRTDGEA
jgi:hypothetical protein